MLTSVYQRRYGRYESMITIGNNNGKRLYKAFFGRTVDEVAVKMEAFRNETNSIAVSLSFSDAYVEWFDSI